MPKSGHVHSFSIVSFVVLCFPLLFMFTLRVVGSKCTRFSLVVHLISHLDDNSQHGHSQVEQHQRAHDLVVVLRLRLVHG